MTKIKKQTMVYRALYSKLKWSNTNPLTPGSEIGCPARVGSLYSTGVVQLSYAF